jgi:polyisoprenoid-binding protein YceI
MTTKLLSVLSLLVVVASSTAAQVKRVELIKEESSITYRLVHPLHTIEAVSKDASYRLDIDEAKREIRNVSVQVDVTTFDSGNSNRDSHAMEVIDALSFPHVTFSSATITQNGGSVAGVGNLTFHGVTREIVVAAVSKWSQNKLEVRGSFNVSLTAFNIERPSLLMIPVEDTLRFAFAAAFGWK